MGAADIAILKGIGFFADLSDFDLAQIAGLTEARSYRAGELIVEERTTAERFFIIIRGKIQISKRFADGDEFVLGVHSDGEFFGEMGLLDEGPRSATVRAVEPTTLVEITRTDFETLLYKAPLLAYRILRELSSRLRETGALLVSFLERRNAQTYRAYLQTIEGFLHRGQDAAAARMVQRARELARAAGREMGLLEEEVLIAEIGVVLRALRIPAEPPALPAPPSSRAARVAAACEGFAELPAGGGSPPSPQEVKRRLGQRFDAETSAALLKLWQEGRLPAEAAGASS
jgi:CRP-like cAMP-binding protein